MDAYDAMDSAIQPWPRGDVCIGCDCAIEDDDAVRYMGPSDDPVCNDCYTASWRERSWYLDPDNA